MRESGEPSPCAGPRTLGAPGPYGRVSVRPEPEPPVLSPTEIPPTEIAGGFTGTGTDGSGTLTVPDPDPLADEPAALPDEDAVVPELVEPAPL